MNKLKSQKYLETQYITDSVACRSSVTLTGKFESQQISKFKFGFSSVNILVYYNLFQDIKLQNTNYHYNYDEQYQKEERYILTSFKKKQWGK